MPSKRNRTADAIRENEFHAFPGGDLVARGIQDLRQGVVSVTALLVSIGAPRLRRCGIVVSHPLEAPEHRLYELLQREHGDAAHSQYNALIQRLVSFERSVESVS
ncbi:MAG TPA: hypothetical protein VGG89_01660 [Candidatus Baltobacteraceae bacterium]|jgi:hypothetical protein